MAARLFVISGPAGVGKDTVLTGALRLTRDLVKSVSVTTRPRAPGEVEGQAYFFVDEPEFIRMREASELLEWARVHEYFYGTPRRWVRDQTAAGRSVVMNIDVQGGLEIKRKFPEAVLVFVRPPGDPLETLRARLLSRGRDAADAVEVRLRNALLELSVADRYDHRIVNDDAARAAEELVEIIRQSVAQTYFPHG